MTLEGARLLELHSSVSVASGMSHHEYNQPADKGLIYMVKSIKPRTEPCGSPECIGAKAEQ